MFTGIVQGQGTVLEIIDKADFRTHVVRLPAALLPGLEPGASVAHNGCCLTVTRIEGDRVSFDLMAETLRVTNLGRLRTGDSVNLERAARFGDEIGGHAMSGHIMAQGELLERVESDTNTCLWFALPAGLAKYVFTKGYIGIDGISLTLGEVESRSFCRAFDPRDPGAHQFGDYFSRRQGEHRDRPPDPGHSGYGGAGAGRSINYANIQ
jgi:riboflavin synthase